MLSSWYFSFIPVCFQPCWYGKLPFSKFSSLLLTCYRNWFFLSILVNFLPTWLLFCQIFFSYYNRLHNHFFFIPISFLLNWCDKLKFFDNLFNKLVILFHSGMFSINLIQQTKLLQVFYFWKNWFHIWYLSFKLVCFVLLVMLSSIYLKR